MGRPMTGVVNTFLIAGAALAVFKLLFAIDDAMQGRRRAAMTDDERKRDDEDRADMSEW